MKTREYWGIIFALALLVTTLAVPGSAYADEVIYVDADATGGANDGSSWADAYTDLQDALGAAASGDELWVAEGVYRPGTARSDSFTLLDGVGLYGGFDGSETGRDQRDWENNVTVLSGDIDGNDVTNSDGVTEDHGDISGDNSYHVVSSGSGVTGATVIDGFTITGGLANSWPDHRYGGGMYLDGAPTLANLIFIGNKAQAYNVGRGGGLFVAWGASVNPTLTNVTFRHNRADGGGGLACYGDSQEPENLTLTDVVFDDNSSGSMHGGGASINGCDAALTAVEFYDNDTGGSGGGLSVGYNSVVTVVNGIFRGNSASLHGGGAAVADSASVTVINSTFTANSSDDSGGVWDWVPDAGATLINCILWGDSPNEIYGQDVSVTHSDVQGGYTGAGNVDADPLFVNAIGGNLRLQADSPCIDAGTSDGAPDTDADGNPRPAIAGYDLGAYEFQHHPGLALSPGTSQTAGYAQPITFTHTLTNGGNYTDTFDLDASGAWLTGYAPPSVTLGASRSAVISLYARVSGTPVSGTAGSLVVTATSQSSPTFYATATDTIVFQPGTGDADGDGISDSTEGTGDPDGDTIPNYLDADSDGDGIPDDTEGTADVDGDGAPNYLDTDSDGDGITDADEGTGDADGDGVPNYLDGDDDDGPDGDADGDGISNGIEGTGDSDGDGTPNYLDSDSDDDGIPDGIEGTADTDGDTIPDRLESNGQDTDGDGTPDYRDTDSDGDGTPDGSEGTGDADGDGIPDYMDADSDGDPAPGGDSDGDTIPDGTEAYDGPYTDTDGDGVPDYMDTDSDGDGIPDDVEGPGDEDDDGIPDYRDRVCFVYLPLVSRAYAPGPVTHDLADAPDDCPGRAVTVGHQYRDDWDRANDNDWYSFQAEAGQTYTIQTSDLGSRTDTIVVLYGPDCSTQLAENDDVSWPTNVASRLVWSAPADTVYRVMVRSYDWRVYGPDTGYTFSVSRGAVAAPAPDSSGAGAPAKPAPISTPAPGGFDVH